VYRAGRHPQLSMDSRAVHIRQNQTQHNYARAR
jgi:hypothetical protein